MGKLLFLPTADPSRVPPPSPSLRPRADGDAVRVTVDLPAQLDAPVELRYPLATARALYEELGAALRAATEADDAARRRAAGEVRLVLWGTRNGAPYGLMTVRARVVSLHGETARLQIVGDASGLRRTRHDGKVLDVDCVYGVQRGVEPGRRVWKVIPADLYDLRWRSTGA